MTRRTPLHPVDYLEAFRVACQALSLSLWGEDYDDQARTAEVTRIGAQAVLDALGFDMDWEGPHRHARGRPLTDHDEGGATGFIDKG